MSALWPLLVILLVRTVLAVRAAESGPRKGGVPPSVSLRVLAVWVVVGPATVVCALAGPETLARSIPLGVFIGVVMMWPLARYLLAPLGLVRVSYYASRASWKASDDTTGTALLTASIALHRAGSFDAEEAAWIEEKIQGEHPLRSGAIAAAASVCAARGDRDGARLLFQSVRALEPSSVTAVARHTAGEWLAADAASRGAWDEVVEIGDDPARGGRAAALLARCAKRLLGRPDAPNRISLLVTWLLAPYRRRTFSLVERALSVADGAPPPEQESEEPRRFVTPDGDLLAKAIAEHVSLLSMKRPAPADVVRAGRAFDAAFEEGRLPDELEARAAELGATRVGHALACFREDVEESLFRILQAHEIALDDATLDLGTLAASAQRRLRNETLAVIEALSDAIRSRVNERRALSAIDEWREICGLRAAYERGVLLGGPELRYLAFTKVHSDLCSLAVWLFNDRKERPIANAVFRFLLLEAQAVGDTAAIELQTKNVDCGV